MAPARPWSACRPVQPGATLFSDDAGKLRHVAGEGANVVIVAATLMLMGARRQNRTGSPDAAGLNSSARSPRPSPAWLMSEQRFHLDLHSKAAAALAPGTAQCRPAACGRPQIDGLLFLSGTWCAVASLLRGR